jgi:hypothetical protein
VSVGSLMLSLSTQRDELFRCRSNVQVHSDVLIPSVNGTAGAFVAVRVDRGGCDAAAANGLFFTVFPQNGTFQVTLDLGTFTLNRNIELRNKIHFILSCRCFKSSFIYYRFIYYEE